MQKKIEATLVKGHQVASGQSDSTPYPGGSISLQKPFFEEKGIDLHGYYDGTLNLSIAPKHFTIVQPDHTVENLEWIKGFPAETFFFARCKVSTHEHCYQGWIYYPHPETKTQHFHNNQLIEVLCPFIQELKYGDIVSFEYDDRKIVIQD